MRLVSDISRRSGTLIKTQTAAETQRPALSAVRFARLQLSSPAYDHTLV